MNNSGKQIPIYSLLLPLFVFLIVVSCSTSKKQYYFSKYSVTKRNSLSPDSTAIKESVVESGEINLVGVDSTKNEKKPKQISLITNSTRKETTWSNDTTRTVTKAEIGSDSILTHAKKQTEQKNQKNQKSEKVKGSKAGIWIIAILTIIILGAIIVNNSIPDFGSGSIFHF